MKPGIWIAVAACAVALGFFPVRTLAADTVCCVCAPTNKLADKACITGPGTSCDDMVKKSNNKAMQSVLCETIILKPGECKPKTETGGLCPIGPITEDTYSTAASADPGSTALKAPIIPKLMVDIPGLQFSNQLEEKGGKISIPFFAQYISAGYRYLTGISAIAAAIMITYGGFLYIFGAARGSTQKGKTIMVDAVIGLILVLGAYTILNTLNPDVLGLKALDVTVIKPQIHIIPETTYQRAQALAQSSGYVPDPDITKALKGSSGGQRPATRMFPDNPFDPRTTIPREELDPILNTVAAKAGVDPCILKAIVNTESGRRQNAVGHDEDALDISIQARLNFLRSGIKYSKETFTPPGELPASIDKSNRDQAVRAVKQSSGTRNDDDLTPSPPEFGLDWRFSHGFGVGQCTIFPPKSRNSCTGANGAYGVALGGKCFTVPILLTWEGQLECMSLLIKAISATAKTPCGIFGAYGGAGGIDPNCTGALLSKKMNAYNACTGG